VLLSQCSIVDEKVLSLLKDEFQQNELGSRPVKEAGSCDPYEYPKLRPRTTATLFQSPSLRHSAESEHGRTRLISARLCPQGRHLHESRVGPPQSISRYLRL